MPESRELSAQWFRAEMAYQDYLRWQCFRIKARARGLYDAYRAAGGQRELPLFEYENAHV